MKYTKTIDVWALTETQRAKLHPGQWVTAGTARGRYMGQKPSGTDVVAWRKGTMKVLRDYAKAK